MKSCGCLLDIGRLFSSAVKLAAVCLASAVAANLFAGEGCDLTATNYVSTNYVACGAVSTNVLWLLLDVPTNASRADLLARTTDLAATNRWLPPGMGNILATPSPWRTTALLEMGVFHAENARGTGCPNTGRRSEDGWFQEVGVGVERDIDSDDSWLSVGFGVSVGRASIRGP